MPIEIRTKIMANQFVQLADLLPYSIRKKSEEFAFKTSAADTSGAFHLNCLQAVPQQPSHTAVGIYLHSGISCVDAHNVTNGTQCSTSQNCLPLIKKKHQSFTSDTHGGKRNIISSELAILSRPQCVNNAISALRKPATYAVWELPSESYCGCLEQLCSEM